MHSAPHPVLPVRVPIQSYGVSKALAALVAGWPLARLFVRRGLNPDDAYTMTFAGAVWGFVGAKAYYLLEHLPNVTCHDLGSSGFTWYGGFLAGVAAALVVARRRGLPLVLVAGLAAAPLSVAYGIGRLGCLLAGDGTYGRPSTLPWAMTFPDAMVPTTVAVQPTPLYEALVAFALAGVLWWLQETAPTGGRGGDLPGERRRCEVPDRVRTGERPHTVGSDPAPALVRRSGGCGRGTGGAGTPPRSAPRDVDAQRHNASKPERRT